MSLTRTKRVTYLGLPVLAVALLSAGCLPGVAWLPDSSGFIYLGVSENDNKPALQIVHYDVAKKEKRVLVKDTDAFTLWPAVSPDGKQLAVAKLVREENQNEGKLEVILYSLDGKERHRSKAIKWPKGSSDPGNAFDKEQEPMKVTQLFWTAQGDKLLVFGDSTTGIYDLKANQMKVLPGVSPSIVENTPITPDGKAFLAVKLKADSDKITGMVLVDWDGKETAIPLKEELLDHNDKHLMLRWPFIVTSRWEGPVAVVSLPPMEIRIDTAKRVATLKETPEDPNQIGPKVIRTYTFAEGGIQIQVIDVGRGGNNAKGHRLEIFKPGVKEPLAARDSDWWLLTPAPNGKLVAARGVTGEIIVINNKGEIIAEIEEKGIK